MPRVYDLVMTHLLDTDGLFIHTVQAECASIGLDFFLIEPEWVETFTGKFQAGTISARSLINMHCEHHLPQDPYTRLVDLAEARGVFMIDPASTARAAFNKAWLHPRLVEAGFPTPPTVIVPRESVAGFVLDELVRSVIGAPFVIKPAMGYGRRGVVLDALSGDDLRRAALAWPDESYLLQRLMVPGFLAGEGQRPLYLRLFYVTGRVWVCWWNCYTDRYSIPTPEEQEQLPTASLVELVRRLAELTRMQFFSTEILLDAEMNPVLIDYVNDQCHMLSQTADPARGVPDAVVIEIARALVQAAAGRIRKS